MMSFLVVCVVLLVTSNEAFKLARPVLRAGSAGSLRTAHSGRSAGSALMAQKPINMPALSSTMKEGKIIAWNKKVGDKVSAGDVLLVVESDKADMDVEAFEDGFLAAIHTPEGGVATVGDAVATLVDALSELGAVGKPGKVSKVASAPAAVPSAPTPATPAVGLPAPAHEAIMMPALSSTMKEGKIVAWNKKIGDKVAPGDMMLVVESDKADMDVESYEEGFLAHITVPEGGIAPVGKPVCYLAKTKEDIPVVAAWAASGGSSAVSAVSSLPSTQAPAAACAQAAPCPATTKPAVVNTGRVSASGFAKTLAASQGIDLHTITPSRPDGYITSIDLNGAAVVAQGLDKSVVNSSPNARKYASEHGIDLTNLQGTGAFGRITGDDVLKAAGKLPVAAPAPAAATAAAAAVAKGSSAPAGASSGAAAPLSGLVPMDGMQKAVAKNMEKTLSVPIFRVTREICTDKLDELYGKLKSKGVSMSTLLAKAVAMVLVKHPLLNANYVDGAVQYHSDINIAMAVAIDGGLITPTIPKMQSMDLYSVARVWKELVDKAKAKKLTPAEYSSGTFTISNLGMFGVHQFDAILPPGMGSILAVSASSPKVIQSKNGHFGVQNAMMVTITCDHRHIYGAHAAEFLRDLGDLLENHVDELTMG